MNTKTVRTEIAARLGTIAGLHEHAFPPGTITPDAAIVVPRQLDPHGTYARGMVKAEFGVIVVTGKPHDRSAHSRLDEYASDDSERSIVTVLEGGTYTSFDDVTVMSIDWDVLTFGGVDYLGALFTLDIAGQGV